MNNGYIVYASIATHINFHSYAQELGDWRGRNKDKTRKSSMHARSRRLLPTPPDSDISTPSPPVPLGVRTERKNSKNEKKDQPKSKPKFQSFISRSKIDQILKSTDPAQAAKDAWIRRKSYNPAAAAKVKKDNTRKAREIPPTSDPGVCIPSLKAATASSTAAGTVMPKARAMARPMSLTKLHTTQGRGDKHGIMFSSLRETEHREFDQSGDMSTGLIRPSQYGRVRSHLTNHSTLDSLVISTMANMANKLCRTVSVALHKALIMLPQEQEEMVSIYTQS